VKTVIKIFSL